MRKYLPFLILIIGVLVVAGVVISSRSQGPVQEVMEEESAPEVPFNQRPVTTLTPKADGHWLTLVLQGANKVQGAQSLDYEVLYTTGDERQQGSSGKVPLESDALVTREILLGSESSGKFRYDEGVSQGTLNLRYRDSKGKLVGKLSSVWHLQTAVDTLTSVDGKFTYKLSSMPKKGFFVTMPVFGVAQEVTGMTDGPYGVFSSDTAKLPGVVTLGEGKVWQWGGESWLPLDGGKSSNIGTFVTSSQ